MSFLYFCYFHYKYARTTCIKVKVLYYFWELNNKVDKTWNPFPCNYNFIEM